MRDDRVALNLAGPALEAAAGVLAPGTRPRMIRGGSVLKDPVEDRVGEEDVAGGERFACGDDRRADYVLAEAVSVAEGRHEKHQARPSASRRGAASHCSPWSIVSRHLADPDASSWLALRDGKCRQAFLERGQQ